MIGGRGIVHLLPLRKTAKYSITEKNSYIVYLYFVFCIYFILFISISYIVYTHNLPSLFKNDLRQLYKNNTTKFCQRILLITITDQFDKIIK